MGPAFGRVFNDYFLDKGYIADSKFSGTVSENNRLHAVLLSIGELHTPNPNSTPAFSLFYFQKAKVLQEIM
jgi:hypothetical protein